MALRSYDGETVLWSFADLDRIKDRFPYITSKRGLVDKWFSLRAAGVLHAHGCTDCAGLVPTVLAALGRIPATKDMTRLARRILKLRASAKEAERAIRRWRQEQKDRKLLAMALRLSTTEP